MSSSATVLVTLKVEVNVGAWNDNATFASLREQVIREARQALINKLSNDSDLRVVGEPVAVEIVLNGAPK